MIKPSIMDKLLDGVDVQWKPVGEVFDILAGGDVPKDALSDIKTKEFNIPILSNGIDDKALYGWTNKAKIDKPSLTISARGTIGWTSIRDKPFFPIVRLLVLTPKLSINLNYAYHFMKMIEKDYKVSKYGIPQLTKPMIRDIEFPIPCPENLEKSLQIQTEIVRILDVFTELTAKLTGELTAELTAHKKQYEYYRDKLLTFEEGEVKWQTLGEMSEIYDGTHQTPKYTNSGVPFVSVQNIRDLYATEKYISVDDFEKYKYKPRKDDLFMTRIGDIGTCAIVENDEPLAYYVTLTLIRVDQNIILPKYLKHVIESSIGKSELHKRTLIHATPIKINLGEIGKINIPFPTLPEQARIVSILDEFAALTSSITEDLPREIELRQKLYEYYRNKLYSFPRSEVQA